MDFSTRINNTALQTEAPGPDRRKHPPLLRMHAQAEGPGARGARSAKGRRKPPTAPPRAGRSEGGGAAKGPTGAHRGPRRGAAGASGGAGGKGEARQGEPPEAGPPLAGRRSRKLLAGGNGPPSDGRRARTGAGTDPGRLLNARRIPKKPGAQAPDWGRARAAARDPPTTGSGGGTPPPTYGAQVRRHRTSGERAARPAPAPSTRTRRAGGPPPRPLIRRFRSRRQRIKGKPDRRYFVKDRFAEPLASVHFFGQFFY